MKLIPNLAEIDRKAITQAGIPAATLMENAGFRIAEAVRNVCSPTRPGVILCGPGNNGGDGFVCARKLHQAGYSSLSVIYTGNAYRNEALANLEALMLLPVQMIDAREQPDLAVERLANADFIVDALFGSGLSRPIEGLEARLIETVNHRRTAPAQSPDSDRIPRAPGSVSIARSENATAPEKGLTAKGVSAPWVLAVDLPSGIDGSTGQVLGCAVAADATLTLVAAKPGLYLYPGKAHAGTVTIADIGIPLALIRDEESPIRLMTTAVARQWLPPRKPDSHKYSYGHVLVIAGSQTMPGAAVLCSEAAMSSSAGLVTLAAPESVFQQVPLMPEMMRLRLPDAEYISHSSLSTIEAALATGKYNAVLIGPGVGLHAETVSFVQALVESLKTLNLPVVIDADGLNALSRIYLNASPQDRTLGSQFILTPHVGECARLLAQSVSSDGNDSDSGENPSSRKDWIAANLLEAARTAQQLFQANVVLKSAATIIATTEDLRWISPAGNPGMATAGSGDVLSGIIAALAAQMQAQQLPVWKAATLGVYLHGLAGDAAAAELTPYAMRASSITQHLPNAFKVLLEPSEVV